jgi:hypothetical protein
LGIEVIFDPGSPLSRVLLCGKPGVDPCGLLQVKGIDVVPRCTGGGGLEPGYRVDTPGAEREIAGTGACPAGAPQRRAATKAWSLIARVAPVRGAPRPDVGDAPRSRRVARRFVEHLVGMRTLCGDAN